MARTQTPVALEAKAHGQSSRCYGQTGLDLIFRRKLFEVPMMASAPHGKDRTWCKVLASKKKIPTR